MLTEFYIVRTGFSGYWGEEFHIMRRGEFVASAMSLEIAERKLAEASAEIEKGS